MSLKITILGCGTSMGVPRVGEIWGNCDPDNPKNARLRSSLLLEKTSPAGVTTVLVDTTPDLRQQLLNARVTWIDGVLYTHEHADHIHGIDDLRSVCINGRRRVDVYFDRPTGDLIRHRFGYCFETPPGSGYPPILQGHTIEPGNPVTISGAGGDIVAMPFTQHHGEIDTLGFRFDNVAYSPDIRGFPDESRQYLEGLDLWIVDALRYHEHPSHYSLEESLDVIATMKPKHAVLTHMNNELDYEAVLRRVPDGVEPAFDGMVIELDD